MPILFRGLTAHEGREYIEVYVKYIHYVERLYEAAKTAVHGHYEESESEHAH